MSPVIPAFHHMYNSTYMSRYAEPIPEDTLTLSTVVVGGAVGGITSKYWILIFSRKHLLQLCHVINILSVLVMALIGGLTWSWEVMIIGRFICGLPIGVYYSLIPTMISEMSARSKQAFWLSVAGFGVCAGILIGGSFSHPKSYFINRFGGLKVNVAANAITIVTHTLFTISQSSYLILKEKQLKKSKRSSNEPDIN